MKEVNMPEKKPEWSSEESHRKQVTLRDIAKELGISHVTVSLALRDHPRISAATKQRVQQKAEEMGYHPDPMLSALSHYRLTSKEKPMQATLAWINPLQYPEKLWKQTEFALYWKGAETIARRLGFKLEEFRTEDLSLKRMDTIFKTRSIRGLLIAPLSWETTPINWNNFPWQDYAGVRFGRSTQGPLMHFVTSAQSFDTMQAFEKTQEKGYKRIGFIGNRSPRRMFINGFLRAQHALPKNRQLPVLSYEGYEGDSHSLKHDMLSSWLKKAQPDAILTDNYLVPSMLEELGYNIPGDMGIATMSLHDTPIDTGIDQNPEEVGRAAVRMLVSLINEHHFGIPEIRNQILVEGRWVDGSMLPDKK
jgi:LacI family repressor for deo operon, udp, cdd, tsx, nupC, and nupG